MYIYRFLHVVTYIHIVACSAVTTYVTIANKLVSTAKNRRATIEILLETVFLRGPSRGVINKGQGQSVDIAQSIARR
jgi:hypothetical protein